MSVSASIYSSKKSSFPSSIHLFSPVHCSRTDSILLTAIIFKYIDRWLLRPQPSVGRSPTEYLQKAKRSFPNEARSVEAKKLEREESDTTWLIWCGPRQLVTEVKFSGQCAWATWLIKASEAWTWASTCSNNFLFWVVMPQSRGSRHFRH